MSTNASEPAGSLTESSALPAATVRQLEEFAVAIAQAMRKTLEGISGIGRDLNTVHDLLAANGNGDFCVWAKDRCGFTPQTAQILRELADEFGQDNPEVGGAKADRPAQAGVEQSQYTAPDAARLVSAVVDDENLEPLWDEAFSAARHEDEELCKKVTPSKM
jgi:hypothetical protein